jgi:GR25 family glycosyltransferase involved in LPS biosynthesis
MSYLIKYINLDHREDRRKHMEKEAHKIELPLIRHRGIPWKELNYGLPAYETMYHRTPGAIGCFESQVEVMREALAENRHAMVLEDDLNFCSDFNKRLKMIEQFTETIEWDIVWLGGTVHRDKPYWHSEPHPKLLKDCKCGLNRDWEPTGNPNFIRTYGAFSTHAYVVNVKSIEKILGLLCESIASSIGIDFSFIRLQPQLQTYAFIPGCVKQIDNQSDIGNGVTEFSRFSKSLGSHWWADKMEDYHEIKHRADLPFLLKKLGITGPSIELGVAQGWFSGDLLDRGVEFLYCVDFWGHIPGIRGDGNFPQEWHDKNYEMTVEHLSKHKNVSILRMMTVEASREFPDNSFALIYHDADHSYQGVKKDIEAYWPKLKPGGIMAFHDAFSDSPTYGVKKAVEDFIGDRDIPINFILENKLEDAGIFIRKPL